MSIEGSKILKDLRARHGGPAKSAARPTAIPTGRCDFRTLASYRQVQIALAAAETFQLPSPYFRRTDAVDGQKVRIGGRWAVNFASYDYLSLNGSERLKERVTDAVRTWGVSARACAGRFYSAVERRTSVGGVARCSLLVARTRAPGCSGLVGLRSEQQATDNEQRFR